MKSGTKIVKNTTFVLAMILVVGATGCASQVGGGSKLDYSESMAATNRDDNAIKVCEQAGAVMHCTYENRDLLREDNERLIESLRQFDY